MSLSVLLYTFRTFPSIENLQTVSSDVFIFGKLNKDFQAFTEQIDQKKPEYILGIAKGKRSQMETTTINRFHKTGIISKYGKSAYPLWIHPNLPPQIKISDQPSATFCNWTMYKTAQYLADHNLKTQLGFIHISPKDFEIFQDWLKKIQP